MMTVQELEIKFPVVLEILRMSRDWHAREQKAYDFHPIIKEIMKVHVPEDYRLLALEYPHQSIKDASNVAYTRDERSGVNDRQTVTTFGRYIRKMFPQLKDHEIRDFATKCRNDNFEIWEDSDGIVLSVQKGPRSCMTWDNSYTPGHDNYESDYLHPYRVYAPELGWKAAVRIDPDTKTINGRALLWHSADNEERCFVRTYKRGNDYSYADESLEYWLKETGYKKYDGWPEGTPLKLISHNGDFLAPYIDGEYQRVDKHSSSSKYNEVSYCLSIRENGEYECTNTDGNPSNSADCHCNCCNEYYHSDDMRSVYEDDDVCSGCANDYYVMAYVDSKVYQERIHEDNVIEYQGEYYHMEYLDDFDLVELHNGDYAKLEDTHETNDSSYVLDSDVGPHGDWVLVDNIAYPKDEMYYCHESLEWYLRDDADPVELNGKTYHPEHVPATMEESE
jgi:hypothetical protein